MSLLANYPRTVVLLAFLTVTGGMLFYFFGHYTIERMATEAATAQAGQGLMSQMLYLYFLPIAAVVAIVLSVLCGTIVAAIIHCVAKDRRDRRNGDG